MSAAERARQVLDLKTLALPPLPKVLEIAVEDYVDSTGDPSLRVDVVLDEATTDEELGEDTFRMKQAIFDCLREAGIDEFPYIFVAKPSELAETEDE
jgi:hypothetical protein